MDSSPPAVPRYDEVAALVEFVRNAPMSDSAATAEALPVVTYEARLLDSGRFEEWLDLWATDAVLWVPIGDALHPAVDQSLFCDDHRRIRERVMWRRDPAAWGQNPPSSTTRVVSAVEAWPLNDTVITRTSILIDEFRRGRHQQVAGHQIHELTGPSLQIRTKILILPPLTVGVRNPSFIL